MWLLNILRADISPAWGRSPARAADAALLCAEAAEESWRCEPAAVMVVDQSTRPMRTSAWVGV